MSRSGDTPKCPSAAWSAEALSVLRDEAIIDLLNKHGDVTALADKWELAEELGRVLLTGRPLHYLTDSATRNGEEVHTVLCSYWSDSRELPVTVLLGLGLCMCFSLVTR